MATILVDKWNWLGILVNYASEIEFSRFYFYNFICLVVYTLIKIKMIDICIYIIIQDGQYETHTMPYTHINGIMHNLNPFKVSSEQWKCLVISLV